MSRDLPLPHLPQEIITNILSKLPVLSLLKFKCVSKSWLSLISSAQFAKLHLLQLKENKTAISRIFTNTWSSFDPQYYCDGNSDYETATFKEHNAINNVRYICFLGSCDGLICGTSGNRNKPLFVFNPTTEQVRVISTPNFTRNGVYFCGFGYDSRIDDYKIVRGVSFSFYHDGFCIEIFNLKGNSWKTIQTEHLCGDSSDEDALLLRDSFYGAGRFLNGVLHWPTRTDMGIIRFDLVDEKFLDRMSIPCHIVRSRSLIVIDECLCLYDLNGWSFSAWKMMNYGDQNSWTRVYEISTRTFPEECYEFLYATKNGHLLFDVGRDYVIVHNPVDGEIKQIGEEGEDGVYRIVYIETLVSPNTAD